MLIRSEQAPVHPEIYDLLSFLDAGFTPWHVAAKILETLLEHGFIVLQDDAPWVLESGKSYVYCRDAAVVAFTVPTNRPAVPLCRWVGAHVDSPGFVLKPNFVQFKEGYQTIETQVYGSPLLNSWLDRDLAIGGRLVYSANGGIGGKLFQSDIVVRIPQLAVHLHPELKTEGLHINPQTQMVTVVGPEDSDFNLQYYLQSFLEPNQELLDFDLRLFDTQKACLIGGKQEFISSARLDDLGMVHASLKAFLDSAPADKRLNGVVYFDHEEVGSTTTVGAGSSFFAHILQRIYSGMGVDASSFLAAMPQSLLISADMAHAVHPGYAEKHDRAHRPRLNQGPVIKRNANARYATDSVGAAYFKVWCELAGVPFQEFVARNDMPCGSTIGPVCSANTGIKTIDVGNSMLSMHSIRETSGAIDHEYMIQVLRQAFAQG
jgi:aspartyl aminopeptidase